MGWTATRWSVGPKSLRLNYPNLRSVQPAMGLLSCPRSSLREIFGSVGQPSAFWIWLISCWGPGRTPLASWATRCNTIGSFAQGPLSSRDSQVVPERDDHGLEPILLDDIGLQQDLVGRSPSSGPGFELVRVPPPDRNHYDSITNYQGHTKLSSHLDLLCQVNIDSLFRFFILPDGH